MLWVQSTQKDYIKDEDKLQSISNLFFPQVNILQVSSRTTTQTTSTVLERIPRKPMTHVLKHIYIPRALNTGTCMQLPTAGPEWRKTSYLHTCMKVCSTVGKRLHALLSHPTLGEPRGFSWGSLTNNKQRKSSFLAPGPNRFSHNTWEKEKEMIIKIITMNII